MKIYFGGAIRAGKGDTELYLQIIEYLKKYGEVMAEHITNQGIAEKDEPSENIIHDRDIDWLLQSDVMFAEVSTPSLGVGYELGVAAEHSKKILCLYRPQEGKRLSAMVLGSPKIVNAEYQTLEEVKKIIEGFFKSI